MKKRLLAAAAVSAVVLGTFTACGSGADIGRDAALEAALNDAGVNEADATRLVVSEDRDDGRKTYDVKFDAAGKEYDYEIQASDGRILSSDIENIEGYSASQDNTAGNTADSQNSANSQNAADSQSNAAGQTNDGTVSQGTQQGNSAGNTAGSAAVAVSQEQAVQIALERVSGATEQDIRIELDYDDGRYKYEGEIRYNNREYDFEIDANSGTILEWSEERH